MADEPQERVPKLARQALDRLLELNAAAEYHLADGREKIKENPRYADGAMADASTQLARQREYIRADLEPLFKRLEKQLRERDRQIAELRRPLAKAEAPPVADTPPLRVVPPRRAQGDE